MNDRSFDPARSDFEEEFVFEAAGSRRRRPVGRPALPVRRPPRVPPRRRPRLPLGRGGAFTQFTFDPPQVGPEPPASPASQPASVSAATPATSTVSRPCPEPAGTAKDRCSSPVPCEAIPDLRCVTQVLGVPFHYVAAVGRDGATGLQRVTKRQEGRTQRMVPGAIAALEAFVRNARSFGLPFDMILTQGSLYCRCSLVKGKPSTALSNHSYGDAIDVAGVRWATAGAPTSRVRETIAHNFRDPEQRGLLRRLNACLRLSFATVIDYHRSDHQDHFHCDTNRGRGRITSGATTVRFVQEALGAVLGRSLKITGELDAATKKALLDYSKKGPEIFKTDPPLNQVFDQLFREVAAGRGSGQAGATTGQGELGIDDVYQRVRRDNIDVKAQRALMRMLQSENLTDRVAAGTILDWVNEFRIQGIFQPDQKIPALAARSQRIGWWQLLEGKRARMICHSSSSVPILIFKKDLDQDSLISVFRSVVSRNRFSRCVDRGRICTVPRCRALFAID